MSNQVIQKANKYQNEFVKAIAQDEEFIKSAERLAELEIKSGHFDHFSHLLMVVPSMPFITGVTFGAANYSKHYKAHNLNEEIAKHKAFLSSVIRQKLEKIKPNFDYISAQEALGYEYFLTTLGTNYLNERNKDVLNNLKQQAHIVAVNASNEEQEEIHTLKTKIRVELDASIQGQAALLKGQKEFRDLLSASDVKTACAELGVEVKDEDIKALCEELGIKSNNQLQQFLLNNNKAYVQLKMACQNLKEKKIQQKYELAIEGFGFVREMGQHFGSKTVYQVGTIGQAAAKIGKTAEILSSKGMKFDFDTLKNFMSIGSAIFSVVNLFSRNQPDPNKMIMDAIRDLANQVHELRKEMHERFDILEDMLGKTHALLIIKFCDLRYDNVSIKQILEEIKRELQIGQKDIKDSLHTITQNLTTIAHRQQVGERKDKIAKIYENINKITSPHQIDTTDFKSLFNFLTTEMNHLQSNDIFLTGSGGNETSVVKSFEEDINNQFSSDFNITAIRQYARERLQIPQEMTVINPLIWCWETLAMIMLMQKRYEQKVNPEHYISKAEVMELKKLKEWGVHIKSFIASLNRPEIFEQMQESYVKAGIVCKSELENYLSEQEQLLTQTLNQTWQNQMDAFGSSLVEAFRSQDIPIALDRHSQWFKSYSTNTHKNFGMLRYDHPPTTPHGYANIEKIKYQQKQKEDINAFKENYIRSIREPLFRAAQNNQALNSYHFNSFSDISGVCPLYHAFILPEMNGQPILPMPSHYRPQIPEKILQAEWLGLGKIKFTYQIENGEFILHTQFVADEKNYSVANLRMPYQSGIYAENEAIWRFWVGGNFNIDGSINDTLVHTYPTHESNVWNYYTYLPKCAKHEGARDRINYGANHVLKYAQETMDWNDNAENEIKDKIKNKRQSFTQEITKTLKAKLQNDDVSSLAQSVIHFSYQFYLLQSILLLIFRDHKKIKQDIFPYFDNENKQVDVDNNHATYLCRNRADLLNILSVYQNDDDHFPNLLDHNIKFFKQLVEGFSEKLRQEVVPCHYELLDRTLDEFSNIIAWYEKHAVDENSLVTSQSNEAYLQQKNDVQWKLLQAIGNAVASVTSPDQQRDILKLLQQQNILLPQDMQNLLMPGKQLNNNETNISNIQNFGLFVGRPNESSAVTEARLKP